MRSCWHPRGGSIPARAGETLENLAYRNCRRVYPRPCGGNRGCGVVGIPAEGLSPPVRGKPLLPFGKDAGSWSIPARAGETPTGNLRQEDLSVYPRTGGGNGLTPHPRSNSAGLSPHGRGKHYPGKERGHLPGSIPARAGET